MTKYSPEEWLETTVRVLKEYLEGEFDRSVYDNDSFHGLDVYEIVPEFPAPSLDLRKMPMQKTIIHFEIDDITSRVVGMGDNIFGWAVDETTGIGTAQEAQVHMVNLDVGIWASDASGGTTSRLRAKQILQNALGGARGISSLREFSNGGDGAMEVISFSGGHFVLDRINDMTVHRMVNCTLVLRVFSRNPPDPSMTGPAIMDVEIDPALSINDEGQIVEIVPD
jgi:hypothetical protein